jgi:hypothetical protein
MQFCPNNEWQWCQSHFSIYIKTQNATFSCTLDKGVFGADLRGSDNSQDKINQEEKKT